MAQAKAQGPVPTPKPRVLPVNATANNAQVTIQMPQNVQLAIPFELAKSAGREGPHRLFVLDEEDRAMHGEVGLKSLAAFSD